MRLTRCARSVRSSARWVQQKKPGVVTQLHELQLAEKSRRRLHHPGRAACCHEAGKLASSTESRAHAVLLLDRVAVRARRSPTAEIGIISSMDHHFHGLAAADRALSE